MAAHSIKDINEIDMVDFLASQGYYPSHVSGSSYWYHSMLPGRADTRPSFKVNRKLNEWKDIETGAGSSMLDFCIQQYDWTIGEAVLKLSQPISLLQNVSQPSADTEIFPTPGIEIQNITPIHTHTLIRYLWELRISLHVAQKYCVEVQYTIGSGQYYALGFQTDAGGYELRNKKHKYSTSLASPTLIATGSPDIAIFEEYIDMLTFVSLLEAPDSQIPDLAVLNGAALFTTMLPVMTAYRYKHLFFKNDLTGDKHTRRSLELNGLYTDHRHLYKGYKSLNEWACNIGKPITPSLAKTPQKDGNGP